MPERRDVTEAEVAILTEAMVAQLFPIMKSLSDTHELSPCQATSLMVYAISAIHKGLHAHETEPEAQPEHDPMPMLNDPQWS